MSSNHSRLPTPLGEEKEWLTTLSGGTDPDWRLSRAAEMLVKGGE